MLALSVVTKISKVILVGREFSHTIDELMGDGRVLLVALAWCNFA